ncbi:MAG: peptide-methionine (S)-S-oxide reductase MsrA [Candidatus Eisenbacteria bacterium]
MRHRIALALACALALVPAQSHAAKTALKPDARTTKSAVAVFAGGCFWCMETQFEGVRGVRTVVSGYTGGHKANPTYEEVCAHTTGHYESIQVTFDPAVITYEQLLERFWHGIDPTQADGQFCDIAETYRSAIFWQDEAQRAAALESKRRLERSGVLKKPIVTEILPGKTFWPAEEYHQDFWKKDPVRYRTYRAGCGRDRRLAQLWGGAATRPLVH